MQLRYRASSLGWSDWSVPASFQTVATPSAPTNRTPKPEEQAVALTGPLTASDFPMPSGADIHEASQWQIASDQDFKEIVHDSGNSQQLASYAIPAGTLKNLALYWFRVRYCGKATGYGDWSSPTSFETILPAGSQLLTTPGPGTWFRPPEIHKWRVTVIGGGQSNDHSFVAGDGGVSIREYRSSEGRVFTTVVGHRGGGTSSFGATQYATGGGVLWDASDPNHPHKGISIDGKGFGGDEHLSLSAYPYNHYATGGVVYGKGGGLSPMQGCILIEWGY